MSLSPPKFGNPPLRWRDLPSHLRLLRLLLFTAWALGLGCLAALFTLQTEVLASPRVATGNYVYEVTYKDTPFYLEDGLFHIWAFLTVCVWPLLIVAFLLILTSNTLEYKLKRRLWDDGIGDIVNRAHD
jgi:hypothetical protein